jgi:hypothetical protein
VHAGLAGHKTGGLGGGNWGGYWVEAGSSPEGGGLEKRTAIEFHVGEVMDDKRVIKRSWLTKGDFLRNRAGKKKESSNGEDIAK